MIGHYTYEKNNNKRFYRLFFYKYHFMRAKTKKDIY